MIAGGSIMRKPSEKSTRADTPLGGSDPQQAIRELLKLLPEDVLLELNQNDVDVHDPAFLDGLTDHVSRLAWANPDQGRRLLGKIIKLKKLIARDVRENHPEAAVSATVARSDSRIGRNALCPCGSGKKFKHCCLRKR
jgi:hypothetical protein